MPHIAQVALVVASLWSTLAVHSATLPQEGTWRTTLQARDVDQDGIAEAHYDSVLGVTWTNPYLPTFNDFGVPLDRVDGMPVIMTWAQSQDWIAAMNDANYLGFNDWRLPVMADAAAVCDSTGGGGNCGGSFHLSPTSSEFAHLMFVTLGVTGLSEPGPFAYSPAPYYWTGTTYASDPGSAWEFTFNPEAYQIPVEKWDRNYVWAVRTGDVAPVPEASSSFLMGAGLVAVLANVRRRIRRA